MTNLDGVTDDQVVEDLDADAGPVGGETETEAQPEIEAPVDYLDIDETLASKYVRIKQDGEDVSVPLREALDGYNSNSVATRRFQEAAQLRQEAESALRLQQAMANNPGLTIQILATQAGMSVDQFLGLTPAQQQQAVAEGAGDEDEYADPLERRVIQQEQLLRQIMEQQEQQAADARLGMAIAGLKQQYQIGDEQVRAVVGQALNMGVGPEMFPVIYESMAFRLQQQAQAQHTASQEAEAARRRAAAQAANAAVSTGNGVSPSGQVVSAGQPITTPRQAIEAALAEHGVE